MRIHSRLVLLTLLWSVLTASVVFSESNFTVTVNQKEWNTGFTVLTAKNLPADAQYLLYSIPVQLMQRLEKCTNHVLLPEEKTGIVRKLLDSEKMKAASEINRFQAERDEILIKTGEVNTTVYKQKTGEIDLRLQKILALDALDAGNVTVPDEMPCKIKRSVDPTGLFPAARRSIYEELGSSGLDFVISGTVEKIENYFYIQIIGTSLITQSEWLRVQEAIASDDVAYLIDQAQAKFVHALLGRKWASLAITSKPSVRIFIDGNLTGVGNAFVPLLTPGKHSVKAFSPDTLEKIIEVELAAFEEKNIYIEPDLKQFRTLEISSEPAGAGVYIAGEWKGNTPLVLNRPEVKTEIKIAKSFYYDHRILFDPAGADSNLSISLYPSGKSKRTIFTERRDGFYILLSFFSAAYLANNILDGLYLYYSDLQANNAAGPEVSTMMPFAYIGGKVAMGTWIGLGVLSFFQLLSVIDGAESMAKEVPLGR